MKTLIPINHADALEALRNGLIDQIDRHLPNKGDNINFKSVGKYNFTSEDVYNDGNWIYYSGARYEGYKDRYDCKLDRLTTDDLSEILTALEKLDEDLPPKP